MNSQQMQYFCKIAECGSFSRAATILGINQSALSRHIAKLEEELGIALFYRNGRIIITTDHGKRLYERACRALEEIRLAEQEAAQARETGIERAVIGMTPTVGRILTETLARDLIERFPKIKLQFVDGMSGHLIEWLDAGRLDVGILYESWATHRLHAERLMTDRRSPRPARAGSGGPAPPPCSPACQWCFTAS